MGRIDVDEAEAREVLRCHRDSFERLAASDLPISEDAQRVLDLLDAETADRETMDREPADDE